MKPRFSHDSQGRRSERAPRFDRPARQTAAALPELTLVPSGFDALGLPVPVLGGIQSAGYTEPTTVQAQAIPRVVAGADVLVSASTGSGKTAAFILPALAKVLASETVKSKFAMLNVEPVVMDRQATARFLQAETRRYADIVKSRGIKAG